jgi:DNA polymerase-1
MHGIHNATAKMEAQLEEYNQVELLKDLELPLAKILSKMEETGIYTEASEL